MQPIIIKKKKVAAHAAHGGAWKVAFADFVTAMMAFFLLMWLLATPTPSQQKAIAGYFNDPGGSLVGPGGANAGMIQMDHPLSQDSPATPPPIVPAEPGGENMQKDRKSTRLNSSHVKISYAVFCLKKKKKHQ